MVQSLCTYLWFVKSTSDTHVQYMRGQKFREIVKNVGHQNAENFLGQDPRKNCCVLKCTNVDFATLPEFGAFDTGL